MTDPQGTAGPAEADDGARTLLQRVGSAAANISDVGSKHPGARNAVQWGVAGLIFASLVFFVVRQSKQLPDFDWRFSPGWLALCLPCVLGFYAIQCECWRLIMRALGEDLEPRAARSIWGKSLLARYVPTSALMVVGRVVMAERLGVPKRVTLSSIVYELGFGVGTAVMVGAYFVIDLPQLQDQPARYAVLVLIPIILTVLHPRVFRPLTDYVFGKLGREPLPATLPFGTVLGFAGIYLVSWVVVGLGLFAFASALHHFDVSDLPYVAASYPVAFCVAVVTFIAPSGLGTRDAAVATAMSAVVAGTVATAIAVAFRIVQTAVELLYVGSVVAIDRRWPGRPRD